MSLFDDDLVIKEVDNKIVIRYEIISLIDKVWNEIVGSISWSAWWEKRIKNTIIDSFLPLDDEGRSVGDYIPELKSLGLESTRTTVDFYDGPSPYFEIQMKFRIKGENWWDVENHEMNVYNVKKYRDK